MYKNFYQWLENKEFEKEVKAANIDVSKYDTHELKMGFQAEKEHDGGEGNDIDIVDKKGDIIKIVLAHLREDPKYYTKLKKAKL